MYQIINKQTKEKIIGTWEEVCDYDKRVWDLSEIPAPASHSSDLQNALCFVKTRTTGIYCMYGEWWMPVFDMNKLSNGGWNPAFSSLM